MPALGRPIALFAKDVGSDLKYHGSGNISDKMAQVAGVSDQRMRLRHAENSGADFVDHSGNISGKLEVK